MKPKSRWFQTATAQHPRDWNIVIIGLTFFYRVQNYQDKKANRFLSKARTTIYDANGFCMYTRALIVVIDSGAERKRSLIADRWSLTVECNIKMVNGLLDGPSSKIMTQRKRQRNTKNMTKTKKNDNIQTMAKNYENERKRVRRQTIQLPIVKSVMRTLYILTSSDSLCVFWLCRRLQLFFPECNARDRDSNITNKLNRNNEKKIIMK